MQFIPTGHYIRKLAENEIFVFGSNTAGRHGAGAARQAMQFFGAKYHEGVGRTGQCYGIPTKDSNIESLPIELIKPFVDEFYAYAKAHPELRFLVTEIGYGLAGNTTEDIKSLFKKRLPNIILPEAFL